MNVAELGEFGLIARLLERCARVPVTPWEPEVGGRRVVGNGDDTAAWETGPALSLATTDTVVEGVHFTRETTPWRDLGWKVMAANISDVASMGGLPRYALVTLGLPPETGVSDVDALYDGMLECCRTYGCSIEGGDIVGSAQVFVTVALFGLTDLPPMLRSTARPGDQVAVTGPVGGSGGGLDLLLHRRDAPRAARDVLVQAHRRPEPQVSAGRALARAGVRCAMDVSDGLVDDLGKLCHASGLAVRLDAMRVPMPDALWQVYGEDAIGFALNGGEDYHLLFCAPPGPVLEAALAAVPAAHLIGKMVAGRPGDVSLVDSTGRPFAVPRRGWDHFSLAPRPSPRARAGGDGPVTGEGGVR